MRGQRVWVVVVVVCVAVVAVPLALSTTQSNAAGVRRLLVTIVATAWAKPHGWQATNVNTTSTGAVVQASEPLPEPNPNAFRAALNAAGLRSVAVQVQLTPLQQINLPGS